MQSSPVFLLPAAAAVALAITGAAVFGTPASLGILLRAIGEWFQHVGWSGWCRRCCTGFCHRLVVVECRGLPKVHRLEAQKPLSTFRDSSRSEEDELTFLF